MIDDPEPEDVPPADTGWESADWPSADWGEPEPPPEDRRTLTGPQQIAVQMHKVFGLKGSGDTVRAARLALIAAILGRDSIGSSKDLTGDDLASVLRELNKWPPDRSVTIKDAATGERVEVFPVDYEPPADAPPTLPQDDSTLPTPAETPERPAPAESGDTPEPVGAPAEWHSAEWRAFLASRKVKATEVIAEARAKGLANVRNLDDLHGWSGCDDLLGFVEDLALSR